MVAVLIGGGSSIIASRYLSNRIEAIEAKGKGQAMVRLVVSVEDLPKGTKLERSKVAAREVPKEWVHSNAILESQFERVENAVLNVPAAQGEPVLWAQLEDTKAPAFSSYLTQGRRALTVPVDEVSSVSGMLEPGDRIDIVCTVKKDDKTVIFSVLQNVAVLAAGTRVTKKTAEDGADQSFNTVTLDTLPDDATRIIAAREVGKITAILRPADDSSLSSTSKVEAMAALGLSVSNGTDATRVPVIYGGSNNKLTDIPGFKSSQTTANNDANAANDPAAMVARMLGVNKP